MRVSFIKMHGLGNDFVVIDARGQAVPAMTPRLAAALADRRTGIGCDQLILIEPSAQADFRMRIFNADGGEVEACGNATRAVGLLHGAPARIETAAGILSSRPADQGISVDMGVPRFGWDEIPLAYAMDTLAMPVGWADDACTLEAPGAANIGNPHVVFFIPDCAAVDLASIGPRIEHDPLFPARVNVGVATVTARDAITLRVWERGVGETLACGTGACAAAVVAMRRGLVDRRVTVRLAGGPLDITWGEDKRIVMTGQAATSYRGSFDPRDFGAV